MSGFTTAKLLDLGFVVNGHTATRVSKTKDSTPCGKKTGNAVILEPLKSTDSIVFRIDPLPKPRMVKSDSWRKRPCVLKYWAYKDELRNQAAKAGFVLGETFDVLFIIPMPVSWSRTKMAQMVNTPHRQRGDIDNLFKALSDCLLVEDSAVHSVKMSKIWGEAGAIVISPLKS